jgi:hypothetical protein
MASGKQADVKRHLFEPIQEEDNPDQKQQVIISCHHMLGTEIDKRQCQNAAALLNEALVASSDTVRHDTL